MNNFEQNGFELIDSVYTGEETAQILQTINQHTNQQNSIQTASSHFAIRQFFKEIPDCLPLVFTNKLKSLLFNRFGNAYFIVKSIYFDKPPASNWFVAYHQDLTISVDKKTEIPGYGPWTTKQNQFSVQPPTAILEDNFTIRIHLDTTTDENGALRVIPGSHQNGVIRLNAADLQQMKEIVCTVKAGGVMLMKPLLLHASGRTTNNRQRRVIHIEFSRSPLPDAINWSEKTSIP